MATNLSTAQHSDRLFCVTAACTGTDHFLTEIALAAGMATDGTYIALCGAAFTAAAMVAAPGRSCRLCREIVAESRRLTRRKSQHQRVHGRAWWLQLRNRNRHRRRRMSSRLQRPPDSLPPSTFSWFAAGRSATKAIRWPTEDDLRLLNDPYYVLLNRVLDGLRRLP